MNLTRKDILTGIAAISVPFISIGEIRKGSLAASSIGRNKNDDNALYKELFIGLTENTLPETIIIPAEVTKIGRQYWLQSSTVKDITFLADDITAFNNTVTYSSPNLTKIRLPNITIYRSWGFVSNSTATHIDLYIPKVKSFGARQNMFDQQSGKTIGIHIDESTCTEIIAFQNFPGLQKANYSQATFYGSDGTITYDGTNWVINQ